MLGTGSRYDSREVFLGRFGSQCCCRERIARIVGV